MDHEIMTVTRDNEDGTERVIGQIIFNQPDIPFKVPLGLAENAEHSVYGENETTTVNSY